MLDGICFSALAAFALAPGVFFYFFGMAPPDLSAQEKMALRLQVFATALSWPIFLLYALSKVIEENTLTGESPLLPPDVLFCMYIACTVFVGIVSIVGRVSIVMIRRTPFPVRGLAAGSVGLMLLILSVFFVVLAFS